MALLFACFLTVAGTPKCMEPIQLDTIEGCNFASFLIMRDTSHRFLSSWCEPMQIEYEGNF